MTFQDRGKFSSIERKGAKFNLEEKSDLHRAQHERVLILSEMSVRGDRIMNCAVRMNLYQGKYKFISGDIMSIRLEDM